MRKVLVLLVLSALASTAAVALAQPPEGEGNEGTEPTVRPEPERTPEEIARRSKRVAKVGDVEITVGDVEDSINAQSPFLRARYQDPQRLQEFVRNMIRFELLASAAADKGYRDHPAVQRTLKQNAVQRMIRLEFDERITAESIPAEDVRQYYEDHESEFRRPEMIRASHILVSSREEATRLIGELGEADARAFRAAAREHSIDTETKLRGGDLRYFTREGRGMSEEDATIDETIVAAAFRLGEVGEVTTQPVAVGENFSIIKLTGRRPAEERSLADAEQGIRLRLWRERRQTALEDLVDGLREELHPEIHEDRMEPIQLDPNPDADAESDEGPGEESGADPHGNVPPSNAPGNL